MLEKIEKLHAELTLAREREAREFAGQVKKALQDAGIDVNFMLSGRKPGRLKGDKIKPKYWNPETGETWSGRGKMPLWLRGKKIEDYLIDNGEAPDAGSHTPRSQ
ncbi:H-NS histone family protein [Burkholderia reimsis]|uniref:H-NS histone family protein n=1 Tax=Burkholderia reimsis TaxID=2234132 RepID=A0A365QGJ4_9BURK|nr:H-NS histone family protein [Burkholderia reimsis]